VSRLYEDGIQMEMLLLLVRMSLWTWVRRLGGLGLVVLGVIDNSPFPLPGSMDALTIVLSANERAWWPYYALMAVTGSLLGGYLTYALGREGGKELMEKKLPQKQVEQIYARFEKRGFWALFIPALLPPPFPFTPFPLAAGVLEYPRRDFLIAVGLARAIRYSLLAFLGSHYSVHILSFFRRYSGPLLWLSVLLVALIGIVFLVWRWKHKGGGKPEVKGKDGAGGKVE
jgi:membrane protein YqaA with SNARE-associated domain